MKDFDERYDAVVKRFGISRKYAGYYTLKEAVRIVLAKPDSLLLVTKWLYPEVAKKLDCSLHSVERNLRTVSRVAFANNKKLLQQITGYSVTGFLTAAHFVDVIAQACEKLVL